MNCTAGYICEVPVHANYEEDIVGSQILILQLLHLYHHFNSVIAPYVSQSCTLSLA